MRWRALDEVVRHSSRANAPLGRGEEHAVLSFLAFAANGLLIGIMVAFSSDQLARILLPLLFAIYGGSVAAFGKDLPDARRREAYAGLLAVSVFCAVGLIGGVLAVQHRWLSPTVAAAPGSSSPPSAALFYIRSQALGEIDRIRIQVRNDQLAKDEAFEQLLAIIQREQRGHQ